MSKQRDIKDKERSLPEKVKQFFKFGKEVPRNVGITSGVSDDYQRSEYVLPAHTIKVIVIMLRASHSQMLLTSVPNMRHNLIRLFFFPSIQPKSYVLKQICTNTSVTEISTLGYQSIFIQSMKTITHIGKMQQLFIYGFPIHPHYSTDVMSVRLLTSSLWGQLIQVRAFYPPILDVSVKSCLPRRQDITVLDTRASQHFH